jgi:hypothetical protein
MNNSADILAFGSGVVGLRLHRPGVLVLVDRDFVPRSDEVILG